jgi:hypothetical protein
MQDNAPLFSSVFLGSLFLCSLSCAQTTIHVPGDQPTIQAGINAATDGDTVLVANGEYHEHINFNGKNIIVTSVNGPAVTTIDGDAGAGPVVRFINHEGRGAMLHGFTIQDGSVTSCCGGPEGGGIEISGASPVISGNIVTANDGAGFGAGINVFQGAPVIDSNTVSSNVVNAAPALGGGISVRNAPQTPPATQITHNVITGNEALNFGGGIYLDSAYYALVANNLIANNSANALGGGIASFNAAGETILQNIITGNSATPGAGIFISQPQGFPNFKIINNTIANNLGSFSGELLTDGYDAGSQIENNIIFNVNIPALTCGWGYHYGPPIVRSNDAFSGLGASASYSGDCTGMSGSSGNISVDPLFVSSSDFHLLGGSPAIDAGDNTAPSLPALDFDLNPRIVDGDLQGGAIIDMGAYELQPFFALGSPQPATVTMTNGAVSTITFQLTGNIVGTAMLSCPGAPTGVTCTFAPSSNVALMPNKAVPATMNIFTSASTPPGTYSVTLSGTVNGIAAPQTQTITLNVTSGVGTTDLAVSATHSPDPVRIGGVLAFTFTINNTGQDATGVTFQAFVKSVLSVRAFASQGSGCTVGTSVDCNLGMIAHGGAATVIVTVTPVFVRSVTAIGIVNSDASDSNPNDNIQHDTGQVRLRPWVRN